jgi:hypothetical protein
VWVATRLWDVDEYATLFIEPDPVRAGSGHITFVVSGLDALLKHLAKQSIGYQDVETYANSVRVPLRKSCKTDRSVGWYAALPQFTLNRPSTCLREE